MVWEICRQLSNYAAYPTLGRDKIDRGLGENANCPHLKE